MSKLHENLKQLENTSKWYLKTAEGSIYGPIEFSTLPDWAAQGRVAPGDHVSKDKQSWVPAETFPELGMQWTVEVGDGSSYGPLNVLALADLVDDGTITSD